MKIEIFVIAHGLNLHKIAPSGTTAAEALISSLAVVQEVSPEDKWCYILFQSKKWSTLSKWLWLLMCSCNFCCGRLCMVNFVIMYCLNMHNIAPHSSTVAETLNPQVLKTSDAVCYFRVKNARPMKMVG